MGFFISGTLRLLFILLSIIQTGRICSWGDFIKCIQKVMRYRRNFNMSSSVHCKLEQFSCDNYSKKRRCKSKRNCVSMCVIQTNRLRGKVVAALPLSFQVTNSLAFSSNHLMCIEVLCWEPCAKAQRIFGSSPKHLNHVILKKRYQFGCKW